MAARTVEIAFLGSTAQLEEALERAGLVAKGSGDAISDAFNTGSSKAGNALEKLGKKAEGLGIPFASGLTVAGKHMDEATTKTGKLTSVLSDVGKVSLLAGAGIAAGVGVAAVKMGEEYESAQAKIQGATGQSTKAVKELTSAFGGTAGQFESSGEEMEAAYAGVSGQLQATEGHALGTAEAMKVMSSATELNTAVQGNLAETTGALSNVMQAFHLSAGQAAGTADTLYNVSTRLDVPVGSLATAMDKLHSRLGVLAPSLGDIGGLMVSLGEHGVTGSRGVQVVNTAFQTLVGGSEKTTEMLKALGVNIFNQQGKFIGLQNVIAQLQPKLAGLTQQQQVFAEKTLFGSGAAQIMGQVVQTGVPAFQRATDAATKMGTAHAAAAKQAETLHGELETAKAAVETLGGDLGLILIPKLTAVAKALAEGITWLTKHKEAALVLGGVIAGPLAAAVSVYASQKAAAFITKTGEMAQSIWKFGAKVLEVIPTILTKLGLIGSTSQAVAAETAAANEAIAVDNQALAASYGMTEADIKAAGIGVVESADTTAAGVDTALGATGVGLVLVGLGLAAVELEQHWNTVMKGLEIAAQDMANGVIKALNKAISVVEKLTLGLVHIGKIKELSGAGEEASKGGLQPLSAKELSILPTGKHGGTQEGSVERQILNFWEEHGFSHAAAAGFAGNAKLESGLNVNEGGGGLYQQSGASNPAAVQGESLQAQSEEVLRRMSPSLQAALKHIKNPAEAARLIESQFEAPAGSQPGEEGYGTPEQGTAHLRQREEAALAAAGGSGSAVGKLLNESSNAKGAKEAESEAKRAKEKSESKAEAAQKKAEEEAKRNLEKITTSGESLLKKYEAEIQSATPAALEKALGVSTAGTVPGPPIVEEYRKGDLAKKTVHPPESVSALVSQVAAGTGKMGQLEGVLSKSASQSVAGKQESKLVDALRATHQQKLEQLANSLVAAHKQALATLASEMVTVEETKQAEGLKLQATEEKDRTTLAEHSAADQLNVVKAEQAQQTDAMKAAGQAIADATQTMSDQFSALTQSIEDQSKVMADSSNAVVQGIKDQTNIEVSILGERGLYGLNLIAQKQEVQLDEMKASYDQQIAQAQREEAELTLSSGQLIAADQLTIDQDKTSSDAATAAAQAHLDAVTVAQSQKIQIAQGEVDSAQLEADRQIGAAELKILAASNAGKQKEAQAAASKLLAEGAGGKTVAEKENNLASANTTANDIVNEAANALKVATESWANTIKEAEKNLARAVGEGGEQLANAKRNLESIEQTAAKEEAAKEKQVAVTKEQSQTQYAGSGLVINQYGMNPEDAAANASAIGWELRSQIPV